MTTIRAIIEIRHDGERIMPGQSFDHPNPRQLLDGGYAELVDATEADVDAARMQVIVAAVRTLLERDGPDADGKPNVSDVTAEAGVGRVSADERDEAMEVIAAEDAED